MDKANKYCLIGKIKGLAVQTQHTRVLIKKAKKVERVWSLCNTKRILGLDARHHLLAYGLTKGTPYRLMEASCRLDNKPNAESILKIIEVHENRWTFAKLWNLEKVQAWLADETVKPVPQPVRPKRSAEFLAELRKKLGV